MSDFDRHQNNYDNQTPEDDKRMMPCDNCSGTGKIDTGFSPTELECPDCKGTGEVPFPERDIED